MSTSIAREVLMIVEESAYGVPVASPVVGTSAFYVPLVESNSYTGVEDPIFTETPYGGGIDIPSEVVADHREVKGSLSCLGYPQLAAFLSDLAITRMSGGTVPFTSSEPDGDAPSVTIYHGLKSRDGTTFRYGQSGMKVVSYSAEASRDDPRLKLKVDFQGQKEAPNPVDSTAAPTSTVFPWPTEAQLPKGPYLFSHTKGNVLLAASALARYQSLSIKITNKPDPRWFEDHWLDTLGVYGIEATADVNLLLKVSPALRTQYLNLVSQGFSVQFNNSVNTLTFNFNGNNHINKLPFDLPLGKEFMQPTTWRNKFDVSAGAAVSVTHT